MRIDKPIYGFIIGALCPFAGLLIMYFLWGQHQGIGHFISSLFYLKDMGGKVFSLSLLANLLPFLLLTSRRQDYAARGVFVATMLYVVFIILFKYVW